MTSAAQVRAAQIANIAKGRAIQRGRYEDACALAVEEGEKACTKCGERQVLEEFRQNLKRPDRRDTRCRTCRQKTEAARYVTWTPRDRALHRERVLRSRYGIEMAVVQMLYEKQEGCCAICNKAGEFPTSREKGRSRSGLLCIDHDHDSGVVRGLLCHNCNSALGKLGDSVDRLVKAAAYLLDRGGQ